MPDSKVAGGLKWVKGEIFVSLNHVRILVEGLVGRENPSRDLSEIVSSLSEVRGVLLALQLRIPALLAEEMRRLSESIANGTVASVQDAAEALMLALIQLPDYLDRVDAGRGDAPVMLLPVINDIRESRGEPPMSEAELLVPSSGLSKVDVPDGEMLDALGRIAHKARPLFLRFLVQWYRGDVSLQGLAKLERLFNQLHTRIKDDLLFDLFRASEAFCQAMLEGTIPVNARTKGLVGHIDLVLKPLEQTPPVWPRVAATHLLTEQLASLSDSDPSAPLVVELASIYGPTPAGGGDTDRGADPMPGARAMSNLAGEIRKELAAAKDELDLYARGNRTDQEALKRIDQQLQGIASAVAVTESTELVTRIGWLARNLGMIASGEIQADDKHLMAQAEELLSIDAVLASMVQSGTTAGTDQWAPTLDRRDLVEATLREARVELARSKEIIERFATDPSDIGRLSDIPSLINRVAGALRMVSEDNAAAVLDGVCAQIGHNLDSGRSLDYGQLELVARALSGVELFIDGLSDDQADQGELLEQAQQAVADLDMSPMIASLGWGGGQEAITDEVAEPAFPLVEQDLPVERRFAAVGDADHHVDTEFLDIFLEEAHEEQQIIAEQFRRWVADRRDNAALTTLRRSFHTLKGSGRLVGAERVAEFARATESVLNRIIEQTLPVSADVLTFVSEAVGQLPDLILAESERRSIDTEPLLRQARDLVVKNIDQEEQPEPAAQPPATEQGKVIPWPGSASAADLDQSLLDAGQDSGVPSGQLADGGLIESLAEDEELLDIFLGETEDHLAVLSDFLATTALEPGSDSAPPESVVRALHTLTGSSRMAGIEAMGQLTHHLELRLGGVRELGDAIDPWLCALLERSTSVLREYVAELPREGAARGQILALIDELDAGDPSIVDQRLVDEPQPVSEAVDDAADGDVEDKESDLAAIDLAEGPDSGVDAGLAGMPIGEEPIVEPRTPGAEARSDDLGPPDEGAGAVGVAPEEELASLPDDPELIAAFLEDARELIDALDERVAGWRREPTDLEHLKALKQLLHTLKGNARLSGLEPIGDLSHATESILTAIDESNRMVDDETLIRVQLAADTVSSQIDAVENGVPFPRALDVLELLVGTKEQLEKGAAESLEHETPLITAAEPEASGEVTAADEEAPDAAPLPDDPEMVAVFLEDARELLDKLDSRSRLWQLRPLDGEHINGLQRLLHTLKGSARLTGITPVGDLSHAMESLLIAVGERRTPVEDDILELAQRTLDTLSDQIQAVEDGQPVPWARGIVAALSGVLQKKDGGPVRDDVAVMAPASETAREMLPPMSESVSESGAGSTLESFDELVAARSKGKARTVGDRTQIRVRSDLLNRLVDHSGEISIYGARLAQKNGLLGFGLGELDQTVERLRQQLRHLEIETEAQILNRYERDQGAERPEHEDFDPLELDRFSTMQQLSRSLSETVNDLVSLKSLLADGHRESADLLIQQARIADDLQDGLLRTRMVPFVQVVPRLHRLVRQTANSLGRSARLDVFGPEVELDRGILDRLVAPLEHLLRNAIAHGIESKEVRAAAGKPGTGVISLVLSREGNEVVITLSDDGAGMNLDAIRERAISRGVLAEDTRISDEDLMQLTLESGFTTASQVTQIAGRGVGLDVVMTEIKKANGTLTLDSIQGRGTSFVIHLPLTLAIVEAMLVDVGERSYAVPHSTIEGVARISRTELEVAYRSDDHTYEHGGHDYRLMYLGRLLDAGAQQPALGDRRWFPLLLTRSGDQRVALHIDNLRESQRVVVKPLGPQLNGVRWLIGGTILPDGSVALILDAIGLVRSNAMHEYSVPGPAQPVKEKRLCVLVVDDSLTVRRVTGRLLRRQNMEVLTAKDGVEALDLLEERIPDVILLDVEMPRMDGYELTRHLRRSSYTKNIPIIMITSRTGAKHQEHAAKLGVDRYLGKPYQEAELLDEISSVLVESSP